MNYITASGAARLERELSELRGRQGDTERIAELERVLASVTIVETPDEPEGIAFGAKVTTRDAAGQLRSYRIVGIDEVNLYDDAVAWVSPIGKALLAAEAGDRITTDTDERLQIVRVDYPVE